MSPINLSSLSHIFCAIVIAANFFRCCSAFNFYKLYAIYGDCCSTFHKISKNTKGVSNVHAIGERVTTNGAALDYVAEFIKKQKQMPINNNNARFENEMYVSIWAKHTREYRIQLPASN